MYELGFGEEFTLDMGDFTVTVQRRSDDWMTYLNGNKGVWGCHKHMDYAIGYMVVTYFGWLQTIEDSDDENLLNQAESILRKPATQ